MKLLRPRAWPRPPLAAALVLLSACTCAPLGCGPERPTHEAPSPRAEPAPAADPPESPAPTEAPAGADTFTPPGPDGYGRAGSLRYLEHVLGGAPEATLPMVVVIHGLGDSPGPHWLDLVQLRRPARLIMPEGPTPYMGGFAWFPFRARDNDPKQLASGISAAAERLAEALAILQQKRPTRGLPIVTGFSQGGMLSFALALRHPERLRLALPISGLLPEPLWPTAPATGKIPPILALHGTADELVPFPPTERLVAHLKAQRYDATLVAYEGVGHSISDAMRARVGSTLNEALADAKP